MARLLTWEWLARGTMFQLANGSEIGLAWRRAGWKKGSGLREESCKNKMVVKSRWKSHGKSARDYKGGWERDGGGGGGVVTALSTSGLKKEFWAKREIDPVFPCHSPPPPRPQTLQAPLKGASEGGTSEPAPAWQGGGIGLGELGWWAAMALRTALNGRPGEWRSGGI